MIVFTTSHQPLRAKSLVWILSALLIGASASKAETPAPGIVSVSAASEKLQILARPGNAPFDIADLAAHQFARDAAGAPVVGHVPVHATDPGETKLEIPRFEGERDRLYDAFIARTADGNSVGPLRHVESLQGVSRNNDPIPVASSKKGLQVQMVDDAIALGVKHAAINIDLAGLVDPEAHADDFAWKMDGREFHFRRGPVAHYDQQIKPLSDAGIQVTAIILNYKSQNATITKIMKPPQAGPNPESPIWAFNVGDPEGAAWYRAVLEFLADRYSGSEHGRLIGYIIGNEVDSHASWYDLGDAPLDGLIENYERAVRLATLAVRKASASARIYLSLDHNWTISNSSNPKRATTARNALDAFARRAREEGDFDWNLAFHPYPKDLADPRTWQDAVGHNANAEIISPRNLEVLPAYFRRPELLDHGKPRHIILSEQGFNTPNVPDGEQRQAAGYCYTWVKISGLEGIDAFILHRHVDHAQEGGLRLGLWTHKAGSVVTPGDKKPLYEVFRACDTPDWRTSFAPYLPVIGIHDWNEVQ